MNKDRKHTFTHESLQRRKDARKLLKALTRGLKKGRLTFSDAENELIMSPEGLLRLKIEAVRDGDRNQVSVTMNWTSESDEKAAEGDLSISSK